MKKWLFILLASTSFAALPPLGQSIREMQALLADPQLYQALGSAEQLQQILRTEQGYLVVTQNYSMQVDIKYGGEQKLIGPVPFQLEFHPPIQRQKTTF